MISQTLRVAIVAAVIAIATPVVAQDCGCGVSNQYQYGGYGSAGNNCGREITQQQALGLWDNYCSESCGYDGGSSCGHVPASWVDAVAVVASIADSTTPSTWAAWATVEPTRTSAVDVVAEPAESFADFLPTNLAAANAATQAAVCFAANVVAAENATPAVAAVVAN
jgi:hypothetical protein